MIHIKKFIDRVSLMESKQNKDIVLSISDARGLRDEIAKLMADKAEQPNLDIKPQQVVINGGSFK